MDVGREQFVSGMKQFLRGPQNKTLHVPQIPGRLPHFSLELYRGIKSGVRSVYKASVSFNEGLIKEMVLLDISTYLPLGRKTL
jgi:hypothetical protein